MPKTKKTEETVEKRPPITPAERDAAKQLVKKAVAKDGIGVVHNIPPITLKAQMVDGFNPNEEATLFEKAVEIQPVVTPLLDAFLVGVVGCDKASDRSYRLSVGEKADEARILALLEAIPEECLIVDEKNLNNAHRYGTRATFDHHKMWTLRSMLGSTAAGAKLSMSDLQQSINNKQQGKHNLEFAGWMLWRNSSIVYLSTNEKMLYIRIVSAGIDTEAKTGKRGKLYLFDGAPNLNVLKPVGENAMPLFTPAEAIAALKTAKLEGFPIITPGAIATLKKNLGERVLACREPGSPGLAKLIVPQTQASKVPDEVANNLRAMTKATNNLRDKAAYHAFSTTATEVVQLEKKLSKKGITLTSDPRIADVVRMAAARPTGKRAPLRPYQDEAVSIHRSTEWGYVNASSPGLGKTVMSLQAMRERACEKGEGYRSLVVCPAAIRSQWKKEAQRFFPEAEVEAFQGQAIIKGLPKFLKESGKKPVVVVVSYNTMVSGIEKLLDVTWDDLICDEATILASTSSARTKALWELRRDTGIAIALTGTPINKGLDDVGRLLAWVRNEEDAFHGQKLSQRFDMSRKGDVEKFWEAIGPCLFRRDRSEIADQLPVIDTEVITIDPEPAELRLAEGARTGLKKLYENLMKKIEVIEQLKPDDPKVAKAKEDIKKVRGAVLGGITLARQAASDPVAVRSSDSAGVALLDAAKLIDPAVKTGGTKRKLIGDMCEDLVGQGESILIFTSFSSVANNLRDDLAAKGVKVGTFTGDNAGTRREKNVDAFQKGELEVLILTGAGREGLNLQRASVVVMLDLEWTPSAQIQRLARAARFGSKAKRLQVLVPIMAGTIEERVAAVLLPRAAQAIAALDTPRGVKASETDMGIAMSGLEGAVSSKEKEGQETMFDFVGEILGD